MCVFQSQLELLMVEEGEEERKGHFSLDSILKQERGGAGKKRSRRKRTQVRLIELSHESHMTTGLDAGTLSN